MARRKQSARKKKPAGRPSRKSARPAWLGVVGSLATPLGVLRKGTILFALGILMGLGIGLAVTLFAPSLLQKPKPGAVVTEAPAKLPKSTPPASQVKAGPAIGPDFVEKTPPAPTPTPAVAPVNPPIVDTPAQAEEGAHQSAPDIVMPDDAETVQAPPQPTPGDKEPAAPQWLENSVAIRDPGNQPMIAIVLDDVGVAPQHAQMAVALPAPIVLSIMTYTKNAPALAQQARAKGHEIMVHMPMQPMNGAINPGPNALDVGMADDELRRRIDWGLGRFKGYVGFNNHMGSRFTQDAAGMQIVLAEAKRRGLLFLDSKTIAGSVADKMAAEMGVIHIARDVFLDDDMSEAAVARQLAAAEAVARRQGYAVAIGHPHPGTIAVLKRWLPEAKAKGFAIVPLTTIIKKREGVAG
ncbi:MAG: divergent polysaccharide deacetylase family protein [Proteobacteria bacterium]|nr:divergent polysaccharide deacetylase family protein [Pseudomonadota bacterium]